MVESVHTTIFAPPQEGRRRKKKDRSQQAKDAETPVLELAGYPCELFEDEELADYANSTQPLIPWSGDENLLVDRYDVRHLLHDLSAFKKRRAQTTADAEEKEVDYWRYLDLTEGAAEAEDIEEEESAKRQKVEAGGYHNVQFAYGQADAAGYEKADDEEEDKHSHKSIPAWQPPYNVPENLRHRTSTSEKQHQIMMQTANFVRTHGGQAEIVLRVKQSKNPNFTFLMPDDPLHPFFRFLVDNPNPEQAKTEAGPSAVSLVAATYADEEEEGLDNSRLEQESALNTNDSAIKVKQESQERPGSGGGHQIAKAEPGFGDASHEGTKSSKKPYVVPKARPVLPVTAPEKPPPAVVKEPSAAAQLVVEKMVEFVLLNGVNFQASVKERDKNVGRYGFLDPGHEFYPWYREKLQAALKAKGRDLAAEEKAAQASKAEHTGKPPKRKQAATPTLKPSEESSPVNNGGPVLVFAGSMNKTRGEAEPQQVGLKPDAVRAAVLAATRGRSMTPELQPRASDLPLRKSTEQPETKPVVERTHVQSHSTEAVAAMVRAATRGGFGVPARSTTPLERRPSCGSSADEGRGDDSAGGQLSAEEKRRAERLRRAKAFAAMVKNN